MHAIESPAGWTLPRGVRGFADPRFAAAVTAFGRLFAGNRSGGALAIYQHGELVADVWGGISDERTRAPWQANTATIPYSATKGISATVVHRLADRGLIDYDAPVSEYWRAFAAKGKGSITVRDVLTHRAGLASVRRLATSLDELLDHELMEERLAAARPDGLRGIPNYHALTFGWLLGGIARNVTGRSMRELFQREIAQPLSTSELYLGRPPVGAPVSVSGLTGSAAFLGRPGIRNVVGMTGYSPGPVGRFLRSIYVPHIEHLFSGPNPRLLDGEVPGANSVVTARALGAMYSALACEGRTPTGRFLSRETVRELARVQTTRIDRTLGLPGWRLGYHSFPIRGAVPGYGHIGLVGSFGWVDPRSQTAVAFIHNRRLQPSSFFFDQSILAWMVPLVMRGANSPIPYLDAQPA